MAHVRTQLRAAVKAALTGIPGVGPNVACNLGRSVNETELPFLNIRTPGEEAELEDDDGVVFRTVTIEIAIMVRKQAKDGQDQADDIAVEIERRMQSQFGVLFRNPEYKGARQEFPEDGAYEFAFFILTYEAEYRTAEDDPETAL